MRINYLLLGALSIILIVGCSQQTITNQKVSCDDGSYEDTGEQCYLKKISQCKASDDGRTCSDKYSTNNAQSFCIGKYKYVNEYYSCEEGTCSLDNSEQDCRDISTSEYVGCIIKEGRAMCGDLPNI